MPLKIQVLAGEQRTAKSRYQPIGVFYPSKMLPVEDRLFLRDSDAALAPGAYLVDLNECASPGEYNRLSVRLTPSALKPAPRAAA